MNIRHILRMNPKPNKYGPRIRRKPKEFLVLKENGRFYTVPLSK